jgi:hypothetical protein
MDPFTFYSIDINKLFLVIYRERDNPRGSDKVMVLEKMIPLYGFGEAAIFAEIEREIYSTFDPSQYLFCICRNQEKFVMDGIVFAENNEYPNLFSLETYHELVFGTKYIDSHAI